MYDVIIIGAGVSGAAAARELSRYQLKICVLERDEDVCCETSKANSGIAHSGYDAEPGSLMAELNVKGNLMMGDLSKELDFPFKRTGSLTVCTTEKGMPMLNRLYERGIKNISKSLQKHFNGKKLIAAGMSFKNILAAVFILCSYFSEQAPCSHSSIFPTMGSGSIPWRL